MAKQATQEEIDRWRVNYWRLRKKYLNKTMAERMGVNASNLSTNGKGRRDPGQDFIKRFDMTFADELGKSEDSKSSSNQNDKTYDTKSTPLSQTEEPAQVRYASWEDFIRAEFSKITSAALSNAVAHQNFSESYLVMSKELAFYRMLIHPDPKK